jgi:glutamate-1-semialdehyde aminotransferase
MPFLHFGAEAELRDRFYGRLARAGVFAHPRHHGFLCWRHDDADLARVVETADRVAATL